MAAVPPTAGPNVESAATLTIPATTVEMPIFPTVRKDWWRLRKRVRRLANPIPWARDVGISSLSLFVAFVIAFFTWLPVYGQLPTQAHYDYASLTPALGGGALFFLVLGIVCLVMHNAVERERRSEIKDVVEFM